MLHSYMILHQMSSISYVKYKEAHFSSIFTFTSSLTHTFQLLGSLLEYDRIDRMRFYSFLCIIVHAMKPMIDPADGRCIDYENDISLACLSMGYFNLIAPRHILAV